MNRSLIFKNKVYRFFLLVFSLTLFFYLFYFFIKPNSVIFTYYKIIKQYDSLKKELSHLILKNENLEDKILRLEPNTLDLDYLDEQLRLHTGKASKNELIVKLDK